MLLIILLYSVTPTGRHNYHTYMKLSRVNESTYVYMKLSCINQSTYVYINYSTFRVKQIFYVNFIFRSNIITQVQQNLFSLIIALRRILFFIGLRNL